jgi:hypothetical protein
MKLLTRLFGEEDPQPATAPAAGPRLDEARQAGDEFLAAADEAIGRALSRDSAAFNDANRQIGGQ